MVLKSIKKDIALLLVSSTQAGVDLIYFTLWKIIEIVFGKDAREERFFNAKGYLIYYIVGSVIGMIVQPVFGLLSDNCSFRKGKRRVMMFLGEMEFKTKCDIGFTLM